MKKLGMVCLGVLLMVCVTNGPAGLQAAEKYPSKPISFIVALEAGSGGDTGMRVFCKRLEPLLGQPVVVVNKPGAGSSIGYRAIREAKPDGYTIGNGMLTLITNKLQGLLPYDYHEYTIMGAIQGPIPLIISATKGKRNFKTLKEVIEFAKAHPGDISVAAGGKGQSLWIYAHEFMSLTGTEFNLVPQAGAGAVSTTQVAGGHVDVGFVNSAEVRSQIDAGNVRILAVFGSERARVFPDVPTIHELGINCKGGSLSFVVGPPNIPKEITDTLVKATEEVATQPEYIKIIEEQQGSRSMYWPPDKTLKELDIQRDLIRDVMQKSGLLK